MKRSDFDLLKHDFYSLEQAVSELLQICPEESLKLITQGSVWINKERVKNPSLRPAKGHLTIYEPQFPINYYTCDENTIIYEDEHLLFAYKEPGVNTCATPITDRDNLYDALRNYKASSGDDAPLYLINRLDNPTDGMVIFTKSKKATKKMHKLFLKRSIKKLYRAATPHFKLDKTRFLFSDRLDWQDRINRKAVTLVIHSTSDKKFHYFYVYPKTGRTHQIRRHFATYLVPLYGDSEYGDYPDNIRLMLSCIMYRFVHPITKKLFEVRYETERV